MNQPIELIDVTPELAGRAICALYRHEWIETAPTKIIGAIVDDLGYVIVITNDELTAVYRYTNREIFKRLKMWPKGVDRIVGEHLAPVDDTPPAERTLADVLGRKVVKA